MTQPPDHPSGLPGNQPIGIPGAQPSSWPTQPLPSSGPSLRKPEFQAPVPPTPPVGGGEALVLAGWGARWGALIIDGCLRLVLSVALAVVAFLLFADDPFGTEVYDQPDGLSNLGGIAVTAFLLYTVLPLIYAPPFMAAWNGATPGKRLLGLRVVTEAGVPPSFGAAMLREAVFKTIVISWIGGIFVLPWLLNYLWPLWDDQSRAGHDFMARTRVVRA